ALVKVVGHLDPHGDPRRIERLIAERHMNDVGWRGIDSDPEVKRILAPARWEHHSRAGRILCSEPIGNEGLVGLGFEERGILAHAPRGKKRAGLLYRTQAVI